MDPFMLQVVIPFLLSAIIVILVTVIAERYGTKVGGILGTLPHLIIIAFIFIAINRDMEFASRAAAVVPFEIGINILFLLLFAHFSHHSLQAAVVVSLSVWSILTLALVVMDISNIFLSLVGFSVCWSFAYIMLERVKRTRSMGKVTIHYTPGKIVGRGVLAGIVIAIAVVLSNVGSVVSGIFSVFPAMFLSAMIISHHEHGPDFVNGLAKSMIFGTPSVTSYAVGVHFLYPRMDVLQGTLISMVISVCIGLGILTIRNRII